MNKDACLQLLDICRPNRNATEVFVRYFVAAACVHVGRRFVSVVRRVCDESDLRQWHRSKPQESPILSYGN